MIDADDLVRGVLSGVLGGRRKRSRRAMRYIARGSRGLMSNPNALLTVAGLAWGVFETLQNQGTPAPAPVPSTAPPPPLLNVQGAAATVPPDALRMVRLAIAAAHADGSFTDTDRVAVVEHARSAGAGHLLDQELRAPRPVGEIVAGMTDPAQRATLYVLAFTIMRGDESVSGAERIFLAQLAHHLGLDPATVTKLESDAAARIDAQE